MYLDILALLNFGVDLLLLLAVNRLSGYPTQITRCLLSAALGGIYGCVCILPGFAFLGAVFWRIAALLLMGMIAFGFRADALRRCVLFVLLSFALGGAALGMGGGHFWSLVFWAGLICLMCTFGLRGRLGKSYLPVVIRQDQREVRFQALVDTGNTLSDPITGQQVLVVSASIAKRLVGLTEKELADAVTAVGMLQGGRLIPYQSVGKEGGMLAAKRFQDVTIGSRHGSCLVAFAPHTIGAGEGYEGLTGGM